MKDFNLVELLRKECYEEHSAKKDQVGTKVLLNTAKRRQRDGNETATSANVVPRSSLRHYLDLTSKRPRPDSVSNPCRVRVLDQ